MSWLVEIAGKAESFLNNIDQHAAVALNAPEELGIGIRRNSKTWKAAKDEMVNPSEDMAASSSMYLTIGQPAPTDTIPSDSSVSKHVVVVDNDSSRTSSNGTAQQQSFMKNFTTPSGRSRPRSKPTTKQEESSVQDIITNNNATKPPSKILANGNSTTSNNKTRSDEELLEFLNSPNQKEIDEVSLLKSELATQARETGLILKNHKKLQQDYEAQRKFVEELQTKLVNPASQVDLAEADNVHQLNRLKSEIKAKDEETVLVRQRLDEALEKLKSMDNLLHIKNRVEQLELENRQAGIKNTELEEKVQNLATQLSSGEKQIQATRDSLVAVEKEFSVYKKKAKAILRNKDELIASIKDGKSRDQGLEGSTTLLTDAQIMAESEITSLKNERELLHGEISQSRLFCDSLKEENRRLESEVQTCRLAMIDLQETLAKERDINHTIQEENLQFSQNVSALQLQLEREKSEKRKLDERLNKFNNENEGVSASSSLLIRSASGSPSEFLNSQAQFSSTSSSAFSSRMNLNQSPVPMLNMNIINSDTTDERDNLKTRIKALTQSLLEKQGLINTVSADKQLLQIRVERLQTQIQEMTEASELTANSGLTQTVISSQPLYLSASPWDSHVARRMKRVYSRVDSLCCQFGLAMRHRPNLRLGFSIYIVFLHLWVFFVLFYWSHQTPIAQPYVK